MFTAGQCWEHGKGGLAARLYPTTVPISRVEMWNTDTTPLALLALHRHRKLEYLFMNMTRQVTSEHAKWIQNCRLKLKYAGILTRTRSSCFQILVTLLLPYSRHILCTIYSFHSNQMKVEKNRLENLRTLSD